MLQHLGKNKPGHEERLRRDQEQARVHLEFCALIYRMQLREGRYFLHEHHWLGTSWDLDCIKKIMNHADVRKVLTNMCQFGMTSRIGEVGSELGPVKKPTGFMTNCMHIANELHKVCPGNRKHVHLVGGRASDEAIYPPGLL